MNNITHLSFSPKLKSVFLPSGEICECFKVDFKKKKIKAYKMLDNKKDIKPTYVVKTTTRYSWENNIGQPN